MRKQSRGLRAAGRQQRRGARPGGSGRPPRARSAAGPAAGAAQAAAARRVGRGFLRRCAVQRSAGSGLCSRRCRSDEGCDEGLRCCRALQLAISRAASYSLLPVAGNKRSVGPSTRCELALQRSLTMAWPAAAIEGFLQWWSLTTPAGTLAATPRTATYRQLPTADHDRGAARPANPAYTASCLHGAGSTIVDGRRVTLNPEGRAEAASVWNYFEQQGAPSRWPST